MAEVKLEVGKNYEIKSKPQEGDEAIDGNRRATWTDGEEFSIEGFRNRFTNDWYDFKPLPSFGDEIELVQNGNVYSRHNHLYYVGENDDFYFVSEYYDDNFSKSCEILKWVKKEYSIRLKSQPPELYRHTNGKDYDKREVDKMIEGLIAVD